MTIILYAILSAAMFYLGSRALITRALWSRYPPRLAALMDCAACAGFWWGTIWALIIGRHFDLEVWQLPADHLATPPIVGLCMIVLAPIAAAAMQWGLEFIGVTYPEAGQQADDSASMEGGNVLPFRRPDDGGDAA